MIKLDLSKISTDDFDISKRNHEVLGPVVLITPGFEKHKWDMSELHLRSVMCREDGEILDSGFGKFLNHRENLEYDEHTRDAFSKGKIYFPEKLDGSLIIRTVINGYVNFRTRGSHHLGEFHNEVISLVESKYPRLMDADYRDDETMLFEFTSPVRRIILKYDEPKLTSLGVMRYDSELPYFKASPELVGQIQSETGVGIPKFYDLNSSPDEVLNSIVGWQNCEGIVAWCELPNGRMHLVKMKTDEYKRLHALRYQMSKDKLFKYCWIEGIQNIEQFRDKLYNLGFDWELAEFLEPDFQEYAKKLDEVNTKVSLLREQMEAEDIRSLSRKDAAIRLQQMVGNDRTMFGYGIFFYTGDEESMRQHIGAMVLDMTSVGIRNLLRSKQAQQHES